MVPAILLSNYLLSKLGRASQAQLQSLCYLCDVFYLANYGKPLVKEQWEAWDSGPVCAEIVSAYEKVDAGFWKCWEFDESRSEEVYRDFIKKAPVPALEVCRLVLKKYGTLSMDAFWRVKDRPWSMVYRKSRYSPTNPVIPKRLIRTWYQARLSLREGRALSPSERKLVLQSMGS